MLNALHGAVGRHRWVVLAIWAAMVAVAIPFALQQSDRLTGGGRRARVESERVESEVMRGVEVNFRPPALAAVLLAPKGTPLRDYRAAANALAKAARDTPRVALDPALRDVAIYQAEDQPGQPVVVPLTLDADEFHAPDVAKVLRKEFGLADGRKYGAVQMHLVGASALWAGMVDLTKDDLAGAERVDFPLVALDPDRGLRLAGRGAVAAADRRRVGADHRGADRDHRQALHDDLLRPQHGLDDRPGGGGRLLAVRRRALPRGAAGGRGPRDGARDAMATSGTAVLFSGLAVVVALGGLLLVPTPRSGRWPSGR